MAPVLGWPEEGLFLGLDSSTQSMKVTALDSSLKVVATQAIQFDSALPQYGTTDGVHRGPNSQVTSPTLMWVEALDLVLARLQEASFPFERVAAVSGSGQQHGSVYWANGARSKLQSLRPSDSLAAQLKDAFATPASPVWMDSSTAKQCKEIEDAVGGPLELAHLTGSRAYERFTASQIRKLYQQQPSVYEHCERISLVSSFMASLLIGDYASIDFSDGAGMNLMDLRSKTWAPAAVQATAPGLEAKLGELAPGHGAAGKIHDYFVKKYGFSEDCTVVNWSGDNPNSFAGLALEKPGDIAVSLGTSDTVFGVVSDPNPGLEGHVFPNPVDPSSYMTMLCYKNGSLTRQGVRDRCADKSWEHFAELVQQVSPGNDDLHGFYYDEPEILPPVPAGVLRFECKGNSAEDATPVSSFDDAHECRAIVEGQLLSMRAHSERIGMPSPPTRVIVTGGASANQAIVATTADVFGCDVFAAAGTDSASLGAALRAAHSLLCSQASGRDGRPHVPPSPFSDVLSNAADGSAILLTKIRSPDMKVYGEYGKHLTIRSALERLIAGM
ncbi:xylulose kinase [Klebsormidium nitens]|uniref:Xylulose kinase n=1 Tax=Klebsormidium nitens TaxID=105231 RepID=A0A1Y1I110_KLENI|nr:xylulose kinase [Klebsormidium nitens]|eukprot:GAQ82467.1 xylulose kinase [Klebsormidium nitens]